MHQPSFSDVEYSLRKRKTKREEFLRIMDDIIPWDEWVAYIEPYYPRGERGRPPLGIEKMLRMYLLQCWFNLSDEGIEDAIYDSYALRSFMKISFVTEQTPDATTLLKFRHLLERHNIPGVFFQAIAGTLERCGYMMRGGTIVDATLNRRVGSVQKVPENFINWEKQIERRKSSVRAKVEHPFLIIKRFFGYSKTVYRGLAKNTHRLRTLFASANLLMCARAGRSLLPA
jgi:IS5 family transposase